MFIHTEPTFPTGTIFKRQQWVTALNFFVVLYLIWMHPCGSVLPFSGISSVEALQSLASCPKLSKLVLSGNPVCLKEESLLELKRMLPNVHIDLWADHTIAITWRNMTYSYLLGVFYFLSPLFPNIQVSRWCEHSMSPFSQNSKSFFLECTEFPVVNACLSVLNIGCFKECQKSLRNQSFDPWCVQYAMYQEC